MLYVCVMGVLASQWYLAATTGAWSCAPQTNTWMDRYLRGTAKGIVPLAQTVSTSVLNAAGSIPAEVCTQVCVCVCVSIHVWHSYMAITTSTVLKSQTFTSQHSVQSTVFRSGLMIKLTTTTFSSVTFSLGTHFQIGSVLSCQCLGLSFYYKSLWLSIFLFSITFVIVTFPKKIAVTVFVFILYDKPFLWFSADHVLWSGYFYCL